MSIDIGGILPKRSRVTMLPPVSPSLDAAAAKAFRENGAVSTELHEGNARISGQNPRYIPRMIANH
jgi:hypothetical protein